MGEADHFRNILETLRIEAERAMRERRPLALVLVDLDHFKLINDTHGHLAGDAVLREASRRMKQACRPYDAIGRYGGEEFLAVVPGCGREASQALMAAASASSMKVRLGARFMWKSSALQLFFWSLWLL